MLSEYLKKLSLELLDVCLEYFRWARPSLKNLSTKYFIEERNPESSKSYLKNVTL